MSIFRNIFKHLATAAALLLIAGVPAQAVFAQAADVSPATQPSTQAATRPTGPERFAKEIAAFEAQDAASMPAPGGIVFVGSSSIRGWKLDQAFADLPVLNRGFGGSGMADALHYQQQTVLKYQPGVVVLYTGENDIARGESARQVFEAYVRYEKALLSSSDKTQLVFISAKPSPSRVKHWAEFQAFNALVAAHVQSNPRATFVDVTPLMLKADGQPDETLFVKDMLHMNAAGYAKWNQHIRPVLLKLIDAANGQNTKETNTRGGK